MDSSNSTSPSNVKKDSHVSNGNDSFHQSTTTNALDASRRDLFFSNYIRHQPFAFPKSIMYYIARNPSSANVYQKLIASCKYFFVNNPILVLRHLNLKENNDLRGSYGYEEAVDISYTTCKIWLTDRLTMHEGSDTNAIIPKLFKCEAKQFHLWQGQIIFDNFKVLASKCEEIRLENTSVIAADGTVIALEKIIETLENVNRFYYFQCNHVPNIVNAGTVDQLIKCSAINNIRYIELSDVNEEFDINYFFNNFIKKNTKTMIRMSFCREISDAYKNILQHIVLKILAEENRKYICPLLEFNGMNHPAFLKMWTLFYKR